MAATAAIFAAAVAVATPAAAESRVSYGKAYSVATTSIEGATSDLQGTWNAQFAELSEGDPAVVDAFNSASRSAAQDQIDHIKGVVHPGLQWNFESKGQVTFRSIAIGQLITGISYYGAVPTVFNSTVVIDSRSARPITLADLFIDEQAGLTRLSEQTKILLPKLIGSDEAMPDGPGNAPVPENFANWIPTADGLEIHFAAYQFGPRLAQTITVGWSALSDVLAPNMAALAQG